MKELNSDQIPEALANLSRITKSTVVERLTDAPFKKAISNILLGKNLREFIDHLDIANLLE